MRKRIQNLIKKAEKISNQFGTGVLLVIFDEPKKLCQCYSSAHNPDSIFNELYNRSNRIVMASNNNVFDHLKFSFRNSGALRRKI